MAATKAKKQKTVKLKKDTYTQAELCELLGVSADRMRRARRSSAGFPVAAVAVGPGNRITITRDTAAAVAAHFGINVAVAS